MVYKCTDCGQSLWQDDCVWVSRGGASQIIVCPDCEASVRKRIGDVEEAIFEALPMDGSLSREELVTETEYDSDEVQNALRHLIDMSYLGTTPGWDYRLGTKGREKKEEL